jgi:hypothetical protein
MTDQPSPLELIHALMDADPLIDADAHIGADTDAETDAALAAIGPDALSPDAQELLLGLTESSASLEPRVRERLVGGAARALQKRREAASPLPRLLFLARNRSGESIESIATQVAVAADTLLLVERGQEKLQNLGPDAVANWVRHLHVPTDQAGRALAHTLRVQAVHDQAAASAMSNTAVEDDPFYQGVMTRLGNARSS